MFVIKIPDKCQTNISINNKDVRQKKNQLHLQSDRLSSVQKDFYYSSTRLFDKLPPRIVILYGNTMALKNSKNISHKNAFYSINEFMSGIHYDEQFKFLRKKRS